ncbi:MAG TPA: hypothetical protein VF723_16245 [Pyrinomonadaceae bacterium]|jgi:hypothetical protein
MLSRKILLPSLVAIACSLMLAQSTRAQNSSDPTGADKGSSNSSSRTLLGSPEQEMIARRDIKYAERERQENMERAREAAQLSTELRTIFSQSQSLGRTEIKKLERLEKITRRIRGHAGGTDGDVTLDNPPTRLDAAFTRLVELSETLRKGVEKTPRQVVSASVIERANEVLEVIRYIRNLIR